MSEFNFAVTRITSAQICRAAGVDRCSPIALDNLSDVLIHFMMLLARSATTAAQNDGREEVTMEDIVLSLTGRGIIRPPRRGTDNSDISEFMAWLKSGGFERTAQVSHFQQRTSSALGAAQGAAIAAQQAAHDPQGSVQQQSSRRDDQQSDWLNSLVQQQALMGQEKKFRNTVLGESVEEDVVIAGGPASLEEFFQTYLETTVPYETA
ncbi:Transcription initiation factor TFIID subunit 3 [Wickerhamiella sorbophila]|uniref:Transcription initiation factor TFIID subunit 3 n=1 Tax=Wickerhamiella sorbophila TaxID=45607 RepID=A0A2T0FBU8_9ASCO|nr:Transcription initiation factor TFIID subunit 3 [Wickerhamiella sorbophila]PRT52440.1 Transcription initiation factor TFIID subunit 3 [Wickerhamiella sorbophila]